MCKYHDAIEYEQFLRVKGSIMGYHFTKKEVDELKMMLDWTQIVDDNYERDLSEYYNNNRRK